MSTISRKPGLFTMQQVDEVLTMESIQTAKAHVLSIIKANTTAKVESKRYAELQVTKSHSIQSLAFTMSNFILAYEDLKVVRV